MASAQSDRVPNGKPVELTTDTSKTQLKTRATDKPRRSYITWLLALSVRLFVWYTVLTPFFQCPSNLSELNDSSPRLCKPYLIARSHIEPHVDPYYQAYAAPYVERARPYAQSFNEKIYTPASEVAIRGYHTYGAPALAKGREYGQQQWEAVVIPQLKSAQAKANDLYTSNVDPYLQKAILVSSPYIDPIATKATQFKEEYFLPVYIWSKPFIGKAYISGQNFLVETAIPVAHQGWSSLVIFTRTNLLPTVTGLYSENVEPQLVKIGERLASYREGRKLRTVVDEFESTSETLNTESVSSTEQPVSDTPPTTTASSTTQSPETNTPPIPEQKFVDSREQVASDLELWQQKFAAAADKGIEDLKDRIHDIVTSQLESGAKTHGTTLLEALMAVQDHEIANIKAHINDLVQTLPPHRAPEEEETANEDLLQFIRTEGTTIRDRAHALRQWHTSFEQELARRVAAATNSTLDVLEGIREFGLQEIGTRWTWMDAVTYKDWAKLHALRNKSNDWHDQIHQVGLQHDKVEEAKEVASDILAQGMAIAEDTAKELSRLKEVGKWKIQAREVSDNFESRSEAPPPLPEPEAEPEIEVEEGQMEDGTLEAGDEFVSTTSPETNEPEEDSVSEPSVADDIVSTTTIEIELAEETSTTVGSTANADVPTPTPSTDSATEDIVTEKSESQESETEESETEESDEFDSTEESTIIPTSSKVWGGAAAQAVPNQQPVMDDDEDHFHFAEQLTIFAGEAGERFIESTKAVREALLGQSSIPSFGEQAREQYSRALAAASNALYSGSTSGNEFAEAASEKYKNAVSAASSAFYGAPSTSTSAGPLESISSIASSRLQEGLSTASAQYSSLKASIAPTQSSSQDPIFLDAERRYYEAIGVAHHRYTEFISSASEAVFPSPTPTPEPVNIQGVLEAAINQFHEVSSIASSSLTAVIAAASSMAGSGGEDDARGIVDDAVSKYSSAMLAASATLSSASEYASSAIYGPVETESSTTSDTWEDLVSRASEHIYGAPTPFDPASTSSPDPATAVEEYSSSISSATSKIKDEL
ncbi:hypothetical protein PISL3812_07572 [Talaromyces islandicus]|uniref:Transcription factor hoxa13 n=1 Tax=Talaromyces islandicus TaxID=28573 RepID=A0A0U1M4J9_TALIS|nr:hypothetical protein PISL3812_07572 [Talaromyces islandicus]